MKQGCGGYNPRRYMGHYILSVKMQELTCFSAFLYNYIDSFVFLEVARRGAIAP